jgi:hypothetical protein
VKTILTTFRKGSHKNEKKEGGIRVDKNNFSTLLLVGGELLFCYTLDCRIMLFYFIPFVTCSIYLNFKFG